MQNLRDDLAGGLGPLQPPPLNKLQRMAHLLPSASAGYAVRVLWQILTWWLAATNVARVFFPYLDLSEPAASQRHTALKRDFVA